MHELVILLKIVDAFNMTISHQFRYLLIFLMEFLDPKYDMELIIYLRSNTANCLIRF